MSDTNMVDSTIAREARELAAIIWSGDHGLPMTEPEIAGMLMDAMSIMVERHRAEVVQDECADQRYREGIEA